MTEEATRKQFHTDSWHRFNRCLLSAVHTKTMLLLVMIRKDAKYLPSEDMSSSIISPLIFPVEDRSTCFMYVAFFNTCL